MQVILLALLTSIAFAQKGTPGIQCDPVEAEKECYNLICKNTPKRLIPVDTAELAKAFQAHPFKLSDEMDQHVDALGTITDAIKENAKKKIASNETEAIADEILKSPVNSMRVLKTFFDGELKCVIDEKGSCNLISTDMHEYTQGMKDLFKKMSEDAFVFIDGASIPVKERKVLLNKALSRMEGVLTKEDFKAEKKKISKIKSEADFIIYQMNDTFLPKYESFLAADYVKSKEDFVKGLKLRMNRLVSIDLSSDHVKNRTKRSCRLAAYMRDTISENATDEHFAAARSKVIEAFKTKFLPRLSTSSAAELSKLIKDETFELIQHNHNIYPAPPMLGWHKEGYQEPKTAVDLLNDLGLIDRGQDFKCNVNGKLVADHFKPGMEKIFISKYVLANGFTDIISHELGHWFSHQLKNGNMSSHSSKKIKEVRKCVSSFYPLDKSEGGKIKGDKFRTEEDFADWFSAQAGIGDHATWCDLNKLLVNSPKDNFTPHKGDSHSNFLFRELVMRLNRGEVLPQSCKDLIEVYPELEPKKCEMK